MERYRLERGGMVLGVVTRGEWDGHQGSWRDWGWLEPSADFTAVSGLLAEECRLHDEAVRLDQERGDLSVLLGEAAQLQVEFMRPGVVLVSLADGTRSAVDEFHTEAECVLRKNRPLLLLRRDRCIHYHPAQSKRKEGNDGKRE